MPKDPEPTITLDVRHLAPPEPLELAMEAIFRLPPDGRLCLRIHREPYPLYDILRNNGYFYAVFPTKTGFDIHIWQDSSCNAP
ncbi:DUF2249 domain-containing protein [Paracandidimonas soli]|uniref:DUF2249 domain-containing protein n=2 Tax=Paracandidimonas soli TaxID=1917182 RepID=UPI001051B854|nr:DUF2249 domain-containing protein [Paracandidimonas soli]